MADTPFDPARLTTAVTDMRRTVLRESAAWAKDAQARMRSEAPWHDRNGPSRTGRNARESLETEVGTLPGGDVQIVGRSTRQTLMPWREWSDGAPVGTFLELGTRYMHRRAIIWPVMTSMAPQLKRRLDRALGNR